MFGMKKLVTGLRCRMKLRNPWPAGYTINKRSPYGNRVDPFTGQTRFHGGVDVGGRFRVGAAADGVVKLVGRNYADLTDGQKRVQGGGNTVLIDHGGIVTVYYHGEHQSALVVGNTIREGQFIFMSGNTGRSTANHLHFEVRGADGKMGNTRNPELYLNGRNTEAVLEITGKFDIFTWKAWQTALKDFGLYKGEIDGLPGPQTYTAIQIWAGSNPTGKLNDATKRAVQRRLGVEDDAIWGVDTVSELQKELLQGLAGLIVEEIVPVIVPVIVPKPVAPEPVIVGPEPIVPPVIVPPVVPPVVPLTVPKEKEPEMSEFTYTLKNLQVYAKAIVAGVGGILVAISSLGAETGIDIVPAEAQPWLTFFLAALTAFATWAIPNKVSDKE